MGVKCASRKPMRRLSLSLGVSWSNSRLVSPSTIFGLKRQPRFIGSMRRSCPCAVCACARTLGKSVAPAVRVEALRKFLRFTDTPCCWRLWFSAGINLHLSTASTSRRGRDGSRRITSLQDVDWAAVNRRLPPTREENLRRLILIDDPAKCPTSVSTPCQR